MAAETKSVRNLQRFNTGEPAQSSANGRLRPRELLIVSVLGLAGFAVSLFGSALPSYWADEVASLKAIRLTSADLLELLSHKDAVHGAYYVILHIWTAIFGDSELSTRGLSAFAVGSATSGVVAIGYLLQNNVLAVSSGIIFATLPRSTYMGSETRSYAIAAALAVWAVVILVVALRRRKSHWWILYSVLVAAGIYMFLYTVLLVGAHAAYVAVRPDRAKSVRPFSVALAAALTVSAPLLIVGFGQRGQIAWLAEQGGINIWTVIVEPWFDSSWLSAGVFIVIIGIGVARSRQVMAAYSMPSLVLIVSWVAIPAAALVGADLIAGPFYTARYLSFTTAGAALLVGIALSILPRRTPLVLAVTVLVLASIPTYVGQRQPYAKNGGSDLREVAQYIKDQSHAGDAFFLANDGPSTLRPRLAVGAYPAALAGLQDLAFVRSDIVTGQFSDVTAEPSEVNWRKAETVWVGTSGLTAESQEIAVTLQSEGFHVRSTRAFKRSVVVEFIR